MIWRGLVTAIPTPFANGQLDIKSLIAILQYQIDAGVTGICVCGSTGEAFSLSDAERDTVIEVAISTAASRVRILVGIGSNCTSKSVYFAQRAKKLGASCGLVVMPYYNRPTDDGIVLHFQKIADVGMPIMIYNVPSRTASNVDDALLSTLAGISNVVAIKDATGQIARVANLKNILKSSSSQHQKEFSILSGDDSTAVALRATGGSGLISVVSNIIPATCMQIQSLCDANNYEAAHHLQQKAYQLIKALDCATNPMPIKAAMSFLGLMQNELRLPLVPLSASCCNEILNAIESAKIYDDKLKKLTSMAPL